MNNHLISFSFARANCTRFRALQPRYTAATNALEVKKNWQGFLVGGLHDRDLDEMLNVALTVNPWEEFQ